MDPELLVADYLRDLEAAASHLSPDQRSELVSEVRDHIELALAEAGRADEATVRTVLERLGSPEETVAETVETAPTSRGAAKPAEPRVAAVSSRPMSAETKALLLLTVGAVVLPFVGPLLALWFVSASTRWTLAQKRTATMVIVALLALPAVVLLPPIASGELTWVITTGGFLLPFVPLAGIVAAAYLVASTSLVVTVSRRDRRPT
jgi:uncharacterized membrane protein